jgi:hypothetical protein
MNHFLRPNFERQAMLAIGLVLLVAAGLSGRAEAQASRATQEQDIYESVLRFQMQNWIRQLDKDEADAKNETDEAAARYYDFKVFFLEVEDKDPSDDFMGRFPDISRKLKKMSDSEVAKSVRIPVVDKGTQEHGIIFSVDGIRWLGKSHVKVEGGYHCDGLCAAGYTFDVRLKEGKWVVTRQKMHWIS